MRLRRFIARQRHCFSSAPPHWRAELRQETAELPRGRRGVVLLQLGCAALLAMEGAEHARAAIARSR
eukprot:2095907-Pyramimonas_sp.AAC.1